MWPRLLNFMKSTLELNSILLFLLVSFGVSACNSGTVTNENGDAGDNGEEQQDVTRVYYSPDEFVMGADLSYVNQILDHGGTYSDSGSVENPYKIFRDYGTNGVRVRLWHTPDWVREEVYQDETVPLYSGLKDVEETIRRAKEQDMQVNLDYHYSDIWADPGTQEVPEAWTDITALEVLKDSVYKYTQNSLTYLADKDLMPEMVQLGNEINCGMMYHEVPDGFPDLNICEGNFKNLGEVINSGIKAVRDVAATTDVDTKIILHAAQPENVEWWFDNMTTTGNVTDFDIVGFSYYSQWSDVPLNEISTFVSNFRRDYDKEVMIMETAYSWTMEEADGYGNIFDENSLVEGYPATKEGQLNYMIDLTQEVIDGDGKGVFYWEPAWITSDMKDLWGTGSAWENNALFDFNGETHKGINFYTYPYEFE